MDVIIRIFCFALVCFNLSACGGDEPARKVIAPVCNDNKSEGDELCDGTDLGGNTCNKVDTTFSAGAGTLQCNPDCKGFDTSQCVKIPPPCDGTAKDPGEQCDGTHLGNATCKTVPGAFTGGTLACTDCRFDLTQCTKDPVCNDGVIETPQEECDPAPSANVGNCADLSLGYTSGTFGCTALTCQFDVSQCQTTTPSTCDGIAVTVDEVCDGTHLKGFDCTTVANSTFVAGTLTCKTDCTAFDTSQCRALNGWAEFTGCNPTLTGSQCDTMFSCVDVAFDTNPVDFGMCLRPCSASTDCGQSQYCETNTTYFTLPTTTPTGICWPRVKTNQACLPSPILDIGASNPVTTQDEACLTPGDRCVFNGVGMAAECRPICSNASIGNACGQQTCLQDLTAGGGPSIGASEYVTPADTPCTQQGDSCTYATNQPGFCSKASDGALYCAIATGRCGTGVALWTDFTATMPDPNPDQLCNATGSFDATTTANPNQYCAPLDSNSTAMLNCMPFPATNVITASSASQALSCNTDSDCSITVASSCLNFVDGNKACGYTKSLCVAYCEDRDLTTQTLPPGSNSFLTCPTGTTCQEPVIPSPWGSWREDTPITFCAQDSECNETFGFHCADPENDGTKTCVRYRFVCAAP